MTGRPQPTEAEVAVWHLLATHHRHDAQTGGSVSRPELRASCPCGWTNGPSKNLETLTLAFDAHLALLLDGKAYTAHCPCRRLAVHVQSTGVWYHAAYPGGDFFGHGTEAMAAHTDGDQPDPSRQATAGQHPQAAS